MTNQASGRFGGGAPPPPQNNGGGGFGGGGQPDPYSQHGGGQSSQGGGRWGGSGGGDGAPPPQRRIGPGDDEGLAPAARPEDMPPPGEGGGGQPSKPPQGIGDYYAYVDSVIRWPAGTTINLAIHAPRFGWHRYDVKWDMTPNEETRSDKDKYARWRAYRADAFALGGFTEEPNPRFNWAGWEKTRAGAPVFPYYQFWVTQAGGFWVPRLLLVRLDIGTRFDNVVGVGLAPGNYQAPMPRKLIDWIAERHGWRATPNKIDIKKGQNAGAVVPFVEPQRESVAYPAPGLVGMQGLGAFEPRVPQPRQQ